MGSSQILVLIFLSCKFSLAKLKTSIRLTKCAEVLSEKSSEITLNNVRRRTRFWA